MVAAALALSGCSSASMNDLRDWWTEDLRGPSDEEWERGDPSPYRTADRAGDRDDRRAEPEVFERNPPAPRTPARAVKPRAPVAGSAKPLSSVRAARPPLGSPSVAPTAIQPQTDRPIVPASLVSVAGMTEAGVRGALGSPHEETNKGSQKIWIYRGIGCSVEVNFFLDVTRNAYAALDHKTLGVDGRTAAPGSCLQSAAAMQVLDR